MTRTAVVALGGNALIRNGQAGTHLEQMSNARAMAAAVCRLRDAGWGVVLVHGNGPQVGNLAIQQEEGAGRVPELPLFWLNAMTEGQLGCLLVLAMHEAGRGRLPAVVSVVTHVVVDRADPAFIDPCKPIGPFLEESVARQLADERGWHVGEDSGRGFRRLVPSPEPGRIVELESIRSLVDGGAIVIAAGGGGVPVVEDGPALCGVDAVIDKDLAAQRLATSLGADALVLVTDIAQVMVDYGTPSARPLGDVTADEMQAYADDGQFPAGSMGPKVRSAVRFVRDGGSTAVITDVELMVTSLAGGSAPAGTRLRRSPAVPCEAGVSSSPRQSAAVNRSGAVS
ncbi:MAG: Carbamate kinase [Pseudonocardia sp.]|uniref:carbamate kinase n=1 Tax=Pseudonocardia sp. TaxID=60912 RepID=UPI0026188F8C|nr:carbamate kinase [Pseudonocardia sp.]MCU1626601.1 Carbamate kinase [Pseudonocardia sp.]MDT7700272.1 carbamate kinase [Pseudonocardiales bacterium]